MKAQHKNSQEVFDLSEIVYTKFFGMYGDLVMLISKKIYFIPFDRDNNDTFYDMTNDFEILT